MQLPEVGRALDLKHRGRNFIPISPTVNMKQLDAQLNNNPLTLRELSLKKLKQQDQKRRKTIAQRSPQRSFQMPVPSTLENCPSPEVTGRVLSLKPIQMVVDQDPFVAEPTMDKQIIFLNGKVRSRILRQAKTTRREASPLGQVDDGFSMSIKKLEQAPFHEQFYIPAAVKNSKLGIMPEEARSDLSKLMMSSSASTPPPQQMQIPRQPVVVNHTDYQMATVHNQGIFQEKGGADSIPNVLLLPSLNMKRLLQKTDVGGGVQRVFREKRNSSIHNPGAYTLQRQNSSTKFSELLNLNIERFQHDQFRLNQDKMMSIHEMEHPKLNLHKKGVHSMNVANGLPQDPWRVPPLLPGGQTPRGHLPEMWVSNSGASPQNKRIQELLSLQPSNHQSLTRLFPTQQSHDNDEDLASLKSDDKSSHKEAEEEEIEFPMTNKRYGKFHTDTHLNIERALASYNYATEQQTVQQQQHPKRKLLSSNSFSKVSPQLLITPLLCTNSPTKAGDDQNPLQRIEESFRDSASSGYSYTFSDILNREDDDHMAEGGLVNRFAEDKGRNRIGSKKIRAVKVNVETESMGKKQKRVKIELPQRKMSQERQDIARQREHIRRILEEESKIL